jgi:AraC family transcriptional regulator
VDSDVAALRRGAEFQGLEQFRHQGDAGGVGFCIAGAKPYSLEFSNEHDVICLLLGDIATETRFEDDPERPLVFEGQTSAFHPRGGNVRVRASTVRRGFIAFSYSPGFQAILDDVEIGRARRGGSRNNIRRRSIHALADYAAGRITSGARLEPFELQSLASLVYFETLRDLSLPPRPRHGLSDAEFETIVELIDSDLGGDITCARLAAAAGVPLRVVFDGMRVRTGMSPYQFVMQRRGDRATELLTRTSLPISEVALACGFSSQQHLTAFFSSRLGRTPARIRMNG